MLREGFSLPLVYTKGPADPPSAHSPTDQNPKNKSPPTALPNAKGELFSAPVYTKTPAASPLTFAITRPKARRAALAPSFASLSPAEKPAGTPAAFPSLLNRYAVESPQTR